MGGDGGVGRCTAIDSTDAIRKTLLDIMHIIGDHSTGVASNEAMARDVVCQASWRIAK